MADQQAGHGQAGERKADQGVGSLQAVVPGQQLDDAAQQVDHGQIDPVGQAQADHGLSAAPGARE